MMKLAKGVSMTFDSWLESLHFEHGEQGKMYTCPECGESFEWGDWCSCGLKLKETAPN